MYYGYRKDLDPAALLADEDPTESADDLVAVIVDLVKKDKLSLWSHYCQQKHNNRCKLLTEARCHKISDEDFIINTIDNRLGGKDQVALLVTTYFLEAVGISLFCSL